MEKERVTLKRKLMGVVDDEMEDRIAESLEDNGPNPGNSRAQIVESIRVDIIETLGGAA